MKELYDAAQQLILNNYKDELEPLVLDILTISVMALLLRNEKLTIERLPKILNDVTIYAEDKSTLEISQSRLGNFQENELLSNACACSQRVATFDAEKMEVQEKAYLIISTGVLADNIVEAIGKCTHEFTHLLRRGSIKLKDDTMYVTDGIKTTSINFKTNHRKCKHFYLEEGIVQRYTMQALDMLHEFVKKDSGPKSNTISCFKRNYPKRFQNPYAICTDLLNQLCEDNNFNILVDETICLGEETSELISYFNSLVGDKVSLFTNFSKDLDTCNELFFSHDRVGAMQLYVQLKQGVAWMKKISSSKKLNKKRNTQ